MISQSNLHNKEKENEKKYAEKKKKIHKNRRMEARDFSRERKCAAMKDANTEHIQEESAFFAFLPIFTKKCYPQKCLSETCAILTA